MWGKPPVMSEEAAPPARPVEALDGFGEAHRTLLGDTSIQFELRPMDAPEPPPFTLDPSALAWLAPVLRTVFWVAIALVAAWLVYLIANRMTGFTFRRGSRDVAAEEPHWQLAEQPARLLLSEADALAEQGRYSEAAHLLLHRSIDEIDQRRPDTLRAALTSRDIAALPALPPRPAAAFGAIVRAVERSLFAGQVLAAADWRDCRSAYERFAFAQEWRG